MSLIWSQFNDFRINRDKAIALGTWLKIHTNISHFKIVYPETINYKYNYINYKYDYNNKVFCSEKVLTK